MEYIHYGSSKFNPNRWVDVHSSEGGMFNKPYGGLWASPVDAEFGWREWCMRENFGVGSLARSFRFELSPDARILELTPDNVWELPSDEGLRLRLGMQNRDRSTWSKRVGIDFAKLAEDYDVILYSVTKYPSLYWTLYGWDCDCILVLNKEVIVVG